ncbi:MAG: hypothetical protein WCJ56_10620, partial [bacterium]
SINYKYMFGEGFCGLTIYVQENQGKYPDANWIRTANNFDGIGPSSPKILICPEEKDKKATADENSPISYGYNGLLIKADGKGVKEPMIWSPNLVGAFADATTGKTMKTPGLIGGSAGRTDNMVDISYRHSGGAIIGFIDGHVMKFASKPAARDTLSAINQAFISVPALEYLNYQGSGLTVTSSVTGMTAPCHVNGEYCTQPVLSAIANVLDSKLDDKNENRINVKPFNGEKTTADGICGITANEPPPGAVAIARDAMVVIRSKVTNDSSNFATRDLKEWYTNPGKQSNLYNYPVNNSSRAFFYSKLGIPAGADSPNFKIVANDFEMVQKVAGDFLAIGYCSAAFVDTNRVDIIAVDGISFPNPDPKASAAERYLWPTQAPTTAYPFMRTLYACPPAEPKAGDTEFMKKLPEVLKAVQSGPLFKLSYFLP